MYSYGLPRTQSRPVGPQGRAGIFLCREKCSDLFERAEKYRALALRHFLVLLAPATVGKHEDGLLPTFTQHIEDRRIVTVAAES